MKRVKDGTAKGRLVSTIAAIGVLGSMSIPSWADDPTDRLRDAEKQLGQAQEELAHSTRALADATRAYQDATAKLPAAEAALAQAEQAADAAQHELEVARGRVAAARAADRAAAEKLAAAKAKVEKQLAVIADVTDRIDQKRASVSEVAAEAYRRGAGSDLARVAAALQADSLEELTRELVASKSVVHAEGRILDELKDDRAALSNERVVLEQLRAEAEELRQQAAARLDETRQQEAAAEAVAVQAQQAADAAAAAKSEVENLVAARETAVAAAEDAKAADAQEAAEWEAERQRIQAEIAEIERREREERERAERERREREERERQEREEREAEEPDSQPDPPDEGTDDTAEDESDDASDEDESPDDSSSGLLYPVTSPYITSPYGMRVHPLTGVYKLHDGTDFRAYCGTPIRAAAAGEVEWAHYRGAYGNQVAVSHSGMVTTYSHLSSFSVSPGESVAAGEIVGYSGTTGSSTACHLHFMLYVDGSLVDPMSYL